MSMAKNEIIETIKDNLRAEVRLTSEYLSTGFKKVLKCEISLYFNNELISQEHDWIDTTDIIDG
jgi:hypothetical protein